MRLPQDVAVYVDEVKMPHPRSRCSRDLSPGQGEVLEWSQLDPGRAHNSTAAWSE
jgi:hypothetical protein